MSSLSPQYPTRWWFEREFLLVLLVLCLSYLPRLNILPVRGEESRRARVSFELIDSGDWVVPREQGDPFLSRPPLQNWLIAMSSKLVGNRGSLAIRIPSVLASFGLVVIIYGYCRHFLGSVGSLTAALAFFSGVEMLKTGRSAETEAIYVFLISSSLLLWHLGRFRNWNPLVTWLLPYFLAACACLTKGGLQPPIYLLGATGAYLLLTGKWKEFFSLGHILSAIVGVSIVGAWYWWCAQRTGWETTSAIWMSDTASRFAGWKISHVVQHLLSFPAETIGCLMPWLPMLVMFFSAPFRNSLDKARPAAIFCGVAAGIAFFTIWLPPDGATRYFMPLYPCVAVLVGIVIDRLLSAPAALVSNRPLRIWITVIVGCYLAIAIGLPIASLIMSSGRHANYVPVLSHALFYSLCLAVVSIVIFLNRRLLSQRNYLVTVIAIALGAAVISNGVIDDARIRRSSDTEASVARVKELLPRGTSLVSLGHLRHLFTYYYDTFIPARPLPPSPQDVGPGDYFCFNWQGDGTPKLPFGWTEIARVKVNRFSDEKPAKWVIVARRT